MGPSSSGLVSVMSAVLGLLVIMTTVSSDHKDAHKVMCYHSRCGNRSIYDFKINDVHGQKPIDWTRYRGNVVMLVNVASF